MMIGILVMLLVGTVTSAIAFSQQNSIENAAREGSRYAATLPDPGTATWLANVRDVTRNAAMKNLNASVPGQYICVAYISGTGTVNALRDTGGAESTSTTVCYNDNLPATEARVQVVTRRNSEIEAVLFSTDLQLKAESAARHERN